jgi:hypothetical protein
MKDDCKTVHRYEKSGTRLCDQLLQKALDTENVMASEKPQTSKITKGAPKLQENQLPQGIYKVGTDIPAGVFDFHHVWGNGYLQVYKAEETILGNLMFGEYVGDTYEYEKADCMHVVCENDWYVHVGGNLIVSISKSKKININL